MNLLTIITIRLFYTMIMARYTPPNWALVVYVALMLVFVNPVTPHPVGTSQSAKTGKSELSQATHILPSTQIRAYHDKRSPRRRTSERLSQRDPSSDESIVSILVPVAPASDYLPYSYDHPTTDKQEISTTGSKIVPQRLKHYGELFNNQDKYHNELLEPDTELYSSSTLHISPSHYISFFSYRISFPFLKYAPKCLPRFPLPGIFKTVVLLLALVWIAILTIALVELGNYMWKKRRDARLVLESDNIMTESMLSGYEDEKIPLRVMTVPGREGMEGCAASLMNDYNSESGSDSEPDVEDYRIF